MVSNEKVLGFISKTKLQTRFYLYTLSLGLRLFYDFIEVRTSLKPFDLAVVDSPAIKFI